MLHHYGNNHGTFFSLLFPLSGSKHSTKNNTSSSYHDNDTNDMFSSSTVDCTLSLGTPSTRHAENTQIRPHGSRQSGSCASTVSSDVVSTESNGYNKQLKKSASTNETKGSTRLTRRCANCDTTSTPLWRNGPRGPKSLCNACGIRYKKEERRAAAAAAAAAASPVLDCTSGYISGYSYQSSHQHQNWGCYASTVGKSTGFSSYTDDTPWRFNVVQPQAFQVMDRAGLFQYN